MRMRVVVDVDGTEKLGDFHLAAVQQRSDFTSDYITVVGDEYLGVRIGVGFYGGVQPLRG